MVNKGSHFADFVRFHSHTYTRTQQSLPPLWAAIKDLNENTPENQEHSTAKDGLIYNKGK